MHYLYISLSYVTHLSIVNKSEARATEKKSLRILSFVIDVKITIDTLQT